ncbi:MAG: hypothetical protein R3B67_13000 [Phycisphaerales bacterium]
MIASAPQPAVLHLVSAPGTPDRLRQPLGRSLPVFLCARAIEQGLTPPGRVLLIGDSDSAEYATSLGLRFHDRLAPPLGRVSMLSRSVRRAASGCARVICWNDELAPLLRSVKAPADLISTRPSLMRQRVSSRVEVRVFERADRKLWESKNNNAELESVLTPLIDRASPFPTQWTRARLGIDPGTICIGIIADRPSDIDARSMGFLLGLLHVAGFPIAAIVPRNASHLTDARRHHHALGNRFRFLVAQQPMLTMLPVFDVLLHPCFDGSGSSMLIERLCENLDTTVLRLRHSGREGLSRAPGLAGPIIEALDDILANRSPDPVRREVPVHV